METVSGRYINNRSFSSSLLDEIYRSIDDSFEEDHGLKRPIVSRRSTANIEQHSIRYERDTLHSYRASSSSSSCGCSSSNDTYSREFFKPHDPQPNLNMSHGGKFVKTKSKALKIYSELKKMKKPISPRLSMFFHSIFGTRDEKKRETEARASRWDRKSKSANASTCSSASSFSRSCLSNTPSSRGKSSNGIKRTVRFYPVSAIVDEECRPCGKKSICEDETCLKSDEFVKREAKVELSEDNLRISEAARNLLKDYGKKAEYEFNSRISKNYKDQSEDDMSDSSSDLFELDNLSFLGTSKYREELPVYETTYLHTNRAIANGLLM